MFVTDAIAMDDFGSRPVLLPDYSRFIQSERGSLCIGDHGGQYVPEKHRPVEAEAILECGRRLQFTVAPVTGEHLYCRSCDRWEVCRVPGGFLFRCETCNSEPEAHYGHNSISALARARKHLSQKGGQGHRALIGQYTEHDIIWKSYSKGMEL